MPHLAYVGNGPYCYANSFAMILGHVGPGPAPSTAVIEVATSGPFGMQLIGGKQVFFDAYGWNPGLGFDQALTTLGWTSTVTTGGPEGRPDEALARLAEAAAKGPVWAGPVEMGHLRHQPEMTGPIGADHYVVVLEVGDDRILIHDPQGYPYAEVPVADFLTAWRAETVNYGTPYTMRTDFAKIADVSDVEAIRASIPHAIRWLSTTGSPAGLKAGAALGASEVPDVSDMPPGSLGNAAAAERVADLIEAGAGDGLREQLIYFAVRVGARRLNDTADCLLLTGYPDAAAIAANQARLVGSLQHPMVTGDYPRAAAALRALAPTYDRLLCALAG